MTPGWALASSSLFYLRHFSSFHFFLMTSSRRLSAECTSRLYDLPIPGKPHSGTSR